MSINPNINKVLRLQNLQLVQEESNVKIFTKNYDTGELHLRGRGVDGKLHGKNQIFYKNGNVHCNFIYKEGELHGLCKGYYLHGTLALEVLFDMGKAVYGFYYKKSGNKTLMTSKQLEQKSDFN